MTATATRLVRASRPRREARAVVQAAEDRVYRLALRMLKDLGDMLDEDAWRLLLQANDIPAELVMAVRGRVERFANEVRPILAKQEVLSEQIDFDDLARFSIGDLIRSLEMGQLATVREILRSLFEIGPTHETIDAIGRAVGLTERQLRAVLRAWRAAREAGASYERAAHAASAVRERLRQQRARTIARTEANRHANSIVQARGEELLRQGKTVKRLWLSARDDNVDGGDPQGPCALNDNGEWIGLFDPFPSGHPAPPAHPNCRCLLELWVET